MRKGMTIGQGKGYRNYRPMLGHDKRVHTQSGHGMKQPQRIPLYVDFSSAKSMKKSEAIKYNLEKKGYIPTKTIQLGFDKWKTEYVKGGKLMRGDLVTGRFIKTKGQVVSTNPFAVKYDIGNKKAVRLSNPKYWEKGGKQCNHVFDDVVGYGVHC